MAILDLPRTWGSKLVVAIKAVNDDLEALIANGGGGGGGGAQLITNDPGSIALMSNAEYAAELRVDDAYSVYQGSWTSPDEYTYAWGGPDCLAQCRVGLFITGIGEADLTELEANKVFWAPSLVASQEDMTAYNVGGDFPFEWREPTADERAGTMLTVNYFWGVPLNSAVRFTLGAPTAIVSIPDVSVQVSLTALPYVIF